MPESIEVFGIKFVKDEFDDEDRYLSNDGRVTTDLGNAWYNSDINHANWYAKYKSEKNSAIESIPFSFRVNEDGNAIV